MKNVSIKDIAELAGVSTATVSRVFRQSGYVQEETKNKILQIAEEQGYKPKDYKKRDGIARRTGIVGIVVADLQNVFFQEIIESITNVLKEHDIHVIVCNSAESVQQELRCLNMMSQLHVDGLFISPVSETALYNADYIKHFNRSGTPVILIDRDIKGVGMDGVFQDNYTGAINAIETLIEHGHQHIAHIAGPITSKPGLDRLNGYIDALKLHNIPVQQEYIFFGNFKLDSGHALTQTLLRKYPAITALFVSNNLMSIGALRAIHEAGLRVPDDIALISTGSLNHFDLYGDAAISELQLPSDIMGTECANMMLERLSNPQKRKREPAKRITYNITLMLKGSEQYPVNRKAEEPPFPRQNMHTIHK